MIFSYTKFRTAGPNGTTLRFINTDDNEATQLATVDGVSYVHVPDSVTMPDQPIEIGWRQVSPDEALMKAIRAASPNARVINAGVVAKIRSRYSLDDEIKLLRTRPSAEFDEWNMFVEECRAWGDAEKAKIGLVQPTQRLNINTATQAELESLLGVGPVRSKAIIDARPWTSISDLSQIEGISADMVNSWADRITV